MGIRQSKEEALYLMGTYGDVEGVRALHREGAGLEWVDKDGKTPLILACLRPDGLEMAKTLLELGANINAYRPGYHAGTPLHHAAKKGFEQTVNLLLSHGANALKVNDDCRTPLDLARAKGHCNIVRNIESRICLFAGWLRVLHGPSFLEAIVPKWVSKKIWAVVLPCHHRSPVGSHKLELVIYPTLQDAQPQTVVQFLMADVEEANFNQPDPAVVIVECSNRKRFKFLSENEGDKQQLLWFYNACKGTVQHNHNIPIPNRFAPASPVGAPVSAPEDAQLGDNASLQFAVADGLVSGVPLEVRNNNTGGWANSETNAWGPPERHLPSVDATSGWANEPKDDSYQGWSASPSKPTSSTQNHESQKSTPAVFSVSQNVLTSAAPSAPPLSEETFTHSTISYPSIDSSPIDGPTVMEGNSAIGESKESKGDSGTCAICLDAPVEGACIPCGHMAGCMPCLNLIKAKKGFCPVCRMKIDQVIKLYSV